MKLNVTLKHCMKANEWYFNIMGDYSKNENDTIYTFTLVNKFI